MFPGLPRAFPNSEWIKPEDVFRFSSSYKTNNSAYLQRLSPEEQWVQEELEYYENNFCSVESLTFSVTTFNVGCKKPQLPLNDIVALESVGEENRAKATDVIVLAFQEVDMSASAMLKEETEAAVPWIQGCDAAIGADSDPSPTAASPYFALKPKQLVGLLLCVYLRRGLVPHLKEYLITTVATGALGSLGNKGAVGVHLSIHRSNICIITAHLAAGQNNVSKRNEDINSILKGMDFNASRRADLQTNANSGIVPEMVYPELFPRDHDFIIVAGDLNYRLNLPYEEAVGKCMQGNIEDLLRYDQLKAELKNPHTPWQGFDDLTPTHLPTYRFDMGTDNYDTSEKRRIPSFTDRICIWYKRLRMRPLTKVHEHTAIMSVRSSDHKPVRAILDLPVKVEVPSKKAEVIESLRGKVRSLGVDQASSAKVTADVTMLDFGMQQFHRCHTSRIFTVTNTGDSVAVVKVLRQKPAADEPVKDGAWLRVSPQEFSIVPGEKQEITVETVFDPRCMSWLAKWRPYESHGRIALAAALLVMVRSGPTCIVDCQAVMVPSIFGNSLENILLLGALPCVNAYQAKVDRSVLMSTLQPQVPKELWFLVDAVSREPFEKGLFTASIDSDVCNAVMAHLDEKVTPLPRVGEPGYFDVHCVANCILLFLQNLQEPIVPFAIYNAALAAGKAKGKAPLALLSQLPNARANVWIYIMSFLNFLLRPENNSNNELTPSLLALVFSGVLLVRPTAIEGLASARLLQGGGVDQQVRQQLQAEKDDAKSLVEFFLTAAPAYL